MAKEKIFTTKELSEKLGIKAKALRRKLRAMDKYMDGKYTKYQWTKKEFDELVKKLAK